MDVLTATDNELQIRKEELLHLMEVVPAETEEEAEYIRSTIHIVYTHYSPSVEWDEFYCEYHDIDEEQDVRAYYAAHPDECRECFNKRPCSKH